MWVYFLGEAKEGKVIKIGSSKQRTVAERIRGVDNNMLNEHYVLLAALRGEARAETDAQDYFDHVRLRNRGKHKEYFEAVPELVEYVLWLRAQHCVCIDPQEVEDVYPAEDVNYWLPRPERRIPPPRGEIEYDRPQLMPRDAQLMGHLAGTAWAWMPDPLASYKDYFTPPDIVKRAWRAMGGIDLDPASHFLANKRFIEAGIRIGEYFTRSHDAFEHDWHGRIWLNPPYGDYRPWFERIAGEMAAGRVEQVCMISPMWAFGTKLAQPHMARASAMVVLSPTPEFYNPGDKTKTGSNNPHGVVYWGDRRADFLAAFADAGIPCAVEFS
jgi:hypothetical protein